ncbi:DNA excision repair protein ERCC-6-like 2 isoform X2 [Rhopilema esculentum]|uniref:DNA excision repair protein ERCC-6-like 2 isoform X2 n=1 Tax=Rhopilema esculentum TaxID=499914 RepID=UPI0031CECDBC|eukprot:gene4875-21206_t
MSSFDSDETLMDESEAGSFKTNQESGRDVCLLSNKDHDKLNTIKERKLHSLTENTDHQKKILELTPSKQTVWCVGEHCMAPFSGDGKFYEGTIEKICRDSNPYRAQVRYIGYESDDCETVPLSVLCLSPQTKIITERKAENNPIKESNVLKKYSDKKEKYMKQKYESSEEESVKNTEDVRRKISKKRKLCFDGASNRKSAPPTASNTLAIEPSLENDNGSKNNKESPSKSFELGFTEHDLEKPHFEIEPVSEKVPFVLSSKDEAKVVKIPSTINQYLRDYQREGALFMYKHMLKGEGCVLGDDMGLGKTVQVIALISAAFGKTGTKEDVIPSFMKKKKEQARERDGPFLIVSPSSVLYNWEDELNTWGYFSISRFHRASKTETIEKAKRRKLDVVLTTYETFRSHVEEMNAIDWICIVMDEAHRIKEPKSLVTKAAKKMKCRCRIGLTGTPMQNKMEELWCLLDWVNPGCLGSLEEFTEHFALPIKHGQTFEATKRQLATARKKQQEFALLKEKWILRRTKDILQDQLPRKDERAVFAPLTQIQTALYEAIVDLPSIQTAVLSKVSDSKKAEKEEVEKHRAEIFHVITLLRKVANHAALLLPYHKASKKQQEMALSVCKKIFGKFPELEDIYRDGSFAKMSDCKFSGKLRIVDRLLNSMQPGKDKVLLFSTSVQLLNILEAYVLSKGYIYRRLDGDTRPDNRMHVIREFNNQSDVFICLVSTKAGGVGLNFTGANVVIIFDPSWNPSYDNQAEDRAYRIGQHRNVRVYRLISEGCIEENIYLRQVYKQQLSNIAIETSNERRLFKGVAGSRTNYGELFGLKNLFVLRKTGSNLTNDVLRRTEKIECGVRSSEYELKRSLSNKEYKRDVTLNSDLDEYEDSQCIEEIESDLEADVNETYSTQQRDHSGQRACDRENDVVSESSTDNELYPPLRWKQGRKEGVESSSLSRGAKKKNYMRKNAKVRKKKKKRGSFIESTSDDTSCEEDKTPQRTLKEDAKESIDDILDECGVTYTSTKKKVLSKSVAEDMMSKEAIKDVFWNGIYSQQPAHFIDHSSSEESDDVLCTARSKKPDAEKASCSSRTEQDDRNPPYSTSSKQRIFERVGKDMFLIGETPPLLRKQQFEKISKYFGFETPLEFAKELVKCSEGELKLKLLDFYKSEEPSIVRISSLRNVYFVAKEKSHCANPGQSQNALRGRSQRKQEAGVKTRLRNHGKQSFLSRGKRRQKKIEFEPDLVFERDRRDEGVVSDDENVAANCHIEVDEHGSFNSSSESDNVISHFDKRMTLKLQAEMGLNRFKSRISFDDVGCKRSTENNEENVQLSLELTNSEGSNGILDDLMFSPINRASRPSQPDSEHPVDITMLCSCKGLGEACKRIITDANESPLPLSVLDELMHGVVHSSETEINEGALKEHTGDELVVSDKGRIICANTCQSQDSPSVLDELMG